ncbi:MAG: hypothetical protein ACR2IJ_10430 [Fluviibacter sp.]
MAFNTVPTNYFIKQHGTTVTLRSRTTGSYDDATGVVAITYTDYSAYGYSSTTVPSNLTSDSTIKNSRTVLLTNYQTNGTALPTPKVNDQIIIGSLTLDVVKVDVVKSNTTVVYYSLKTEG